MTPRVLFVDHAAELGGGELMLLDVAHAYRDTSLVTLFADGPFRTALATAGVPVRVMPAPAALLSVRKESARPGPAVLVAIATLAARLARLARAHDVIYANSQKAFIVAALAGLLARRPVVWHLHDILTREHFSAANIRVAVGLANRFAARVIANSEATAAAFVASGGDARRVAVVYNGIDSTPFDAQSEADVAVARQELGVGDAPLIGVFSRLAPWKGQHVVIEALAALPTARAVFVGGALFGAADYAAELQRQSAQLGVAGRVAFLGFRDDVPRLMRACDVVVHSSIAAEPFGRVIVEGMLARRPVIAARAGGAAEIIDHGRTGLLVTPNDPAALGGSVAQVLAQPAWSATMAAAGRADAEARFGPRVMLDGVARELRAARHR